MRWMLNKSVFFEAEQWPVVPLRKSARSPITTGFVPVFHFESEKGAGKDKSRSF